MDAILFLSGGIIDTAHHWYWTGQANFTIALAAMFSALEVVPLTLLTLDVWDFIKLTGTREITGTSEKKIPQIKEVTSGLLVKFLFRCIYHFLIQNVLLKRNWWIIA
jgi:nitric oxide reductase large subunit